MLSLHGESKYILFSWNAVFQGLAFVSIWNIQWRQQEFMAIDVDRLWNKVRIFGMELADTYK